MVAHLFSTCSRRRLWDFSQVVRGMKKKRSQFSNLSLLERYRSSVHLLICSLSYSLTHSLSLLFKQRRKSDTGGRRPKHRCTDLQKVDSAQPCIHVELTGPSIVIHHCLHVYSSLLDCSAGIAELAHLKSLSSVD